jgi:hypothetical protein
VKKRNLRIFSKYKALILGIIRRSQLLSKLCPWRAASPVLYRRDLLSLDHGGSSFLGSPENFTYAPPVTIQGDVPSRINNYLSPITLDPPFIVEVRNAELVGDYALGLSADGRVIKETTIFAGRSALFPYYQKHVDAELDSACSLVHRYNGNYFHWMLERLTLIESVEAYGNLTGQRPVLFVHENLRPWQVASLSALGYGEEDLVLWTMRRVKVRRLLVPSVRRYSENQSAPRDCMSPRASLWLRQRLLDHFVPVPFTAAERKRIYISRRKASSRRVVNEAAILEKIERLGFLSYNLEDLTLAEQVRLFASADVVIAPHGAGLTNVIFAAPGAAVLELLPAADVRPDFFQLSRSVGLNYGALVCMCVNQRNDMQVDLEDLDALLSKLVG